MYVLYIYMITMQGIRSKFFEWIDKWPVRREELRLKSGSMPIEGYRTGGRVS